LVQGPVLYCIIDTHAQVWSAPFLHDKLDVSYRQTHISPHILTYVILTNQGYKSDFNQAMFPRAVRLTLCSYLCLSVITLLITLLPPTFLIV
jgi:hypothetical protein